MLSSEHAANGLPFFRRNVSLRILSKYRNALFGIAILWIIMLHGARFGVYLGFLGKSNPINQFMRFGTVGVDLFLFLSGMGLYFSFSKNKEIIPFIKRRFVRILPTVFLISGIWWFYYFIILNNNLADFLKRISLLCFWLGGGGGANNGIWFVSFILVFYLAYPYIYHYLFDKGNALLRVLIAMTCAIVFNYLLAYVDPSFYKVTEIAFSRIPVTLFGCYFGKLVYDGRKINSMNRPGNSGELCLYKTGRWFCNGQADFQVWNRGQEA